MDTLKLSENGFQAKYKGFTLKRCREPGNIKDGQNWYLVGTDPQQESDSATFRTINEAKQFLDTVTDNLRKRGNG